MMIIQADMLQFAEEYMQLELDYDEHIWADGDTQTARAVWYVQEH